MELLAFSHYIYFMKQLLLIRHAKSSWDSPSLQDFDRPLNDRGQKDAPMMAERLLHRKVKIDAFVSSPAKRALSTAKYFARAFDQKEKDIMLEPTLYQAPVEHFYKVIGETLKDKWDTVAIFSHNPGITYFVNDLNVAMVDSMPTCGIFGVVADIDSWKDFEKAEKKFWMFDYPKKS
jgi:phosphohistidine phosphatase